MGDRRQQTKGLSLVALMCDAQVEWKRTHDFPGYWGPLKLVLLAHALEKGNLCSSLTPSNKDTWGFWYQTEELTELKNRCQAEVVKLPVQNGILALASDRTSKKNTSLTEACFGSPKLSMWFEVAALFEEQHGPGSLVDLTEASIGQPHGADSLKGEVENVVQAKRAGPVAKSKAKVKAKAKAKAVHRRPPLAQNKKLGRK